MNTIGTKIKDGKDIAASLQRIAYQIIENNDNDGELIIAGITKNGAIIADKLCDIIKTISKNKVTYAEIYIDKKNPRSEISLSLPLEKCKNKMVVVVDDVLNTGSTLIYAVNYFLSIPLYRLLTAVLVNRNHKKFPIKADFKGLSISTTIKEQINISLEGPDHGIYLS